MNIENYNASGLYDEMIDEMGACRSIYRPFLDKLSGLSPKKLKQLQHATDKTQLSMGMTFNVYHDNKGMERILHLDIIPRIIPVQISNFLISCIPLLAANGLGMISC